MTDPAASSPVQTPPWLAWALSNLQQGLLVLDGQSRVVFVNRWLLERAGLSQDDLLGQPILEVFPLRGSHFARVLEQVMKTGFPAMLSPTLHPAPLPLYVPGKPGAVEERQPLRQSVHLVPMGPKDAAQAGQRYTLVQVADMTASTRREGMLRAQANKLHEMSRIDTLTGIGNRRAFDEFLAAELRAGARNETPLGLVLLDVDHFKLYNDGYGHVAGDRCLQAVADLLRHVCRRPRDMAARYGGEEFAAILPATDLPGAVRVAREVVQALRDLALPHATSPNGAIVTVSVGVCVSDAGVTDKASQLIRRADQALYAAKNAGRDRVWVYDPVSQSVREST